MIKQFKEIDEFFVKHQFSEIELDLFKNDLKEKYHDKSILKQAISLIELKLLAYKLSDENNDKNVNKFITKVDWQNTSN